MRPHDLDRVGVLTVRVWIEPGVAQWRARITRSNDVEIGTTTSSVADSVDGVCQAVREWLEAFVDR